MSGLLGRILAQAERAPEASALRVAGSETPLLTYAELVAQVERLSATLGEAGLEQGELAALLLPSGPELLIAFLAVLSRGALALPLEEELTRSELSARLEVAEPALAIGRADLLAREALLGLPSLRAAVLLGEEEPDDLGLPTHRPGEARATLSEPADEAEVSCHFTYKGLGYPLGAVHRYRDYALAIDALDEAFPFGAGDRALAALPLQPIYGLITSGLGPLTVGGELVFLGDASPRRLPALLAEEQIRLAALVPPLVRVLTGAARRAGDALAQLHPGLILTSGGSYLPPEAAQALSEATQRPVLQGYGSTEALTVTSNTPAHAVPGSLGRPLGPVEVEVRDASGAPTAPGVAGEVFVRGPQVMSGYLRRPRETARFLRDGWLRPGDLGWLDAEGALHFAGRREAFTKVNARMVDLLEVEQALSAHPAVTRACATTRSGRKGERELRVAVTLTGNASVRLGELISLAKERLAPHKVPKRIKVYRAVYQGFQAEF